MKKAIALCFVIFFLFCGCKKSEVLVKISPMEFTLNAVRQTQEYEILFKTEENLSTVYATVKNLNNMKYTIKNGVATIEYADITVSKKIKDIEDGDVVIWCYKAIVDMNGKTAEKSDNNYVYNGAFYELLTSPSGLPLSITSASDSIKANFSNLTLVK